ncbi:sodium-dependent transporter [Enhygromyxa salina]|uniref:Sodium:neurotransmitter symporter family protein n=1 Tax=Enhygromyxa salina TaxID=215803 RepID=A0A2S9Y2J9_9BACT|nr:sodium-dependent transporter [Enhygromyxa salina]PRP99315.1 Sodium:neurotransmitter symporter family protein [Enhygromyxa salina]
MAGQQAGATNQTKDQWGTRIGVILAVAGSAVGLGNFLRFPGQAAANGGGAFMIPYFCALLVLGIPIGWAEWTMGRYGGRKGFHSAPAIMGVIGRGRAARYLGIIGVLIPLGVSFYYVFIESWCLGYCWQFVEAMLGGEGLGIDPSASIEAQTRASASFFAEFTGQRGDGVIFTELRETALFWLAVIAVNVFFVFRGLSKGIEKFCSLAMPAMAICALIVLIRVLTLGPNPDAPEQNVANGLGFMWNPDFAALARPQTWMAAAGQIFFSLSVGFGVIINYASYLKKKDDVVLSGLTASATNEVFEVGFGGMITLTASFVFLGLSGTIGAVAGGSFGLGFQTLPVVFAHMPMGDLIGALWFFMLFLAAITSSLSMYQPTLAFVQEALGTDRRQSTALVTVLGVAGSAWVVWFSAGSVALGTIDDWVGTFLIVVLAAIQVIVFGWVMGIERGRNEAHEGAQIHIHPVFWFIIKYVAPAYLLVTIGRFVWVTLPEWIAALGANPVARNTVLLIGVVVVFLCALVYVGEKRWRALGMDVDGVDPPNDDDDDLQSNGATP